MGSLHNTARWQHSRPEALGLSRTYDRLDLFINGTDKAELQTTAVHVPASLLSITAVEFYNGQ